MQERLKKISPNLICLLIFGLYFILFYNIEIIGDDLVLYDAYKGLSLLDQWKLVVDDYLHWSSRVLVNAVIHFVLGKKEIVWLLLNSTMAAIFTKALITLFNENKKYNLSIVLFAALLVMGFPIRHMASAGWIVTTMTYYWPAVMGTVALIPIKKIYFEETITWYEKVIYSFSLVYSCNEELELVVIFFCYFAFFIYFAILKKMSKYYLIQLALIIMSITFMLTCPGNGLRGNSEIHWFIDYKMMTFIDKMDIGFTSTMHEILYGSYFCVVLSSFLMFIQINKKYKVFLYRLIGFMQLSMSILFGPILRYGMSRIMQIFYDLSYYVAYHGYVTIVTMNVKVFLIFATLVVFSILYIISLILTFKDLYSLLFSLSLLVSGTGARIAMGLSPTVFASGYRTATPLFFCLLLICGFISKDLLKEKIKNETLLNIGITALLLIRFVFCIFIKVYMC